MDPLAIPTAVPNLLKSMVVIISILVTVLLIFLTTKIYKGEARNEDAGPKNKGW